MLGSIEYSAEYIRLYNLIHRCKTCRNRDCPLMNYRKIAGQLKEWGWSRKAIKDHLRDVITAKCRIAHDIKELKTFDVLRFEELREAFEPLEIDFSEDNARMNACVEVDENGGWVKIELTSLV